MILENNKFKVGIIGYSKQNFNQEKAKEYLEKEINNLESKHSSDLVIVSGLTNIGIPKLAYQIAKEKKIPTVGIACSKAKRYDCFNVDKKIIHGEEWGDESEVFLEQIDFLIKLGGGEQSEKEYNKFLDKNSPSKACDIDI